MADLKISQLPTASSGSLGDFFVVDQAGPNTRKITASNMPFVGSGTLTMYAPGPGSSFTGATGSTYSATSGSASIAPGDQGSALAQGWSFSPPVTTQNVIYNFNPINYPNTRTGLYNVRSGTANFVVGCLGDSTTEGYAGDGSFANVVSKSWVHQINQRISVSGLNAGWQNVFGDHRTDQQATNIQTIDTRVTAPPSGWTFFDLGPGGRYFFNSTNTNPFTFTPSITTDTLDLYYFDINGYDTITIKGGASGATTPSAGGTVTISGSGRIKKATATQAGTSVWTVQKANGTATNLIIAGLSAYNAGTKEVSFINLGCGSQSSTYFNDTTQIWRPLGALSTSGNATVFPLVILVIGINDLNHALDTNPVATFNTNMSNIVTQLQSAGSDVLIVVPNPTQLNTSLANSYYNTLYTIAKAKNCALIDLSARWGGYASAQTQGFISVDGVHPAIQGYYDMASAISQFFLMF